MPLAICASSFDHSYRLRKGTHVAAIAAGKKFGVAGSIPVDIVSVRVLNCEGRGSCSGMIRAMDWVLQNRKFLTSFPYSTCKEVYAKRDLILQYCASFSSSFL